MLLAGCVPYALGADEPGGSQLVTNLEEILPYVAAFSKTLDIDLPQPLTTNDVTWFGGPMREAILRRAGTYRSAFDVVGLRIAKTLGFGFNVRYCLVFNFVDYRHSMTALWRAEDIKPLIRPSKITKKQALEMARQYLAKLGYTEDKLPPLLPPTVHQWKWKPEGAWLGQPLPIFGIERRYEKDPSIEYCHIEIDGYRQKITDFYIMYPLLISPPPAPPDAR